MERRRFLQAASGLAMLSAIPARQLLAQQAERDAKDDGLSPEETQAKLEEIARKYGGEFGPNIPVTREVR